MRVQARLFAIATLMCALLVGAAHGSYSVTAINTTVTLGTNSTASVIELLNVSVSNASIQQYQTNRLALNLTLSQWQSFVGPSLIEHIVNPRGSIYGFNFTPGPLLQTRNGDIAEFRLSYYVTNVTTVAQTGPRLYAYKFNSDVFNFVHGASGAVLGANTTLTMMVPPGSRITAVYPVPDFPTSGFAQNYRNTTVLKWYEDEPLSNFVLEYTVTTSPQSEVIAFFAGVYDYLGWFTIVIVAAAIAVFVIYTYFKTQK